jgi:hypothetical protein
LPTRRPLWLQSSSANSSLECVAPDHLGRGHRHPHPLATTPAASGRGSDYRFLLAFSQQSTGGPLACCLLFRGQIESSPSHSESGGAQIPRFILPVLSGETLKKRLPPTFAPHGAPRYSELRWASPPSFLALDHAARSFGAAGPGTGCLDAWRPLRRRQGGCDNEARYCDCPTRKSQDVVV